ncbi:MAG: tetratricopeptide repeat protein [Proteobacteria bacterium]|nr:tetratricopeptide repeat protein [Pseudomonadota bacterium]MDA1355349.1 tetratricopeptide repeat protein [Pseudomonadota bacterium]
MAAPVSADFDEGLSAFLDGDYRRAREIWMDFSALGDAQSQFGLGMMFEGGRGVPPDAEKAAEWYLRAAEQGMPEAQLSLGSLYEQGNGVARDPERAAELYRNAADQGNAQAQYNLAALYLGGDGVAPNRELGIAWLRLSARQRYGRALQRLKMIDVPVEGSVEILASAPAPEPPPPDRATELPATAPAPNPERAERLQILIEDNQFEVPLAALEEEVGESSAAEDGTPAESGFTLLLATFDRQEAAQAAWQKLNARYPTLFGGLRPKYTALKLDEGDVELWRLEAAALVSESAAVTLCEALRREGEYCFPPRVSNAPEN